MSGDGGHRLVFVGGLHRSGTTPLTRALGRHPAVSALTGTGVKEDEGQHLQDVYPPARHHGGVGSFAFDDAAHVTEDSPLVCESNASRLLHCWSRYWDANAPVWLEKSPPNLIRSRYLQATFPDASFVMIVRHPVIVALSSVKWRRSQSLGNLIEHWLRAHEIMRADARRITRMRIVCYEHLVADPVATLDELGGFLGLSGSIPADSLEAGRSSAYARRWRQLQRSKLPWRSAARLIDRYAGRVSEFGYDMRELDWVERAAVTSDA